MTFFQPPPQVTPPTCKTTGAQAWMGGMELLLPNPEGGSRQVGEAMGSCRSHPSLQLLAGLGRESAEPTRSWSGGLASPELLMATWVLGGL